MDGTIRPLAGGCLRDKRAPVEAAIETEKQVIAPFCEGKHNGQATAGIARPTMCASEPTTSTAPAWPSRQWLSPDRIRDGTREQYLPPPAVPGGGFERPNPLIAGGPDPTALIQIRDRLAAQVEAPAPSASESGCPHLHYQCA